MTGGASGWPILAGLLIFLPLWRIKDLTAQPSGPLFWAILAILATGIAVKDRWLGIFAGYLVLRGAFTRTPLSFETSFAVLAGLVILVTAQSTPERFRCWIRAILVASGVLQVGLQVLQWWKPAPGQWWLSGSIGNPNYLGAFLAITGAIAPAALLLVFVAGILLAKSTTGTIALAVALVVRARARKEPVLIPAFAFGAPMWVPTLHLETAWLRLAVWKLGILDLSRSWLAMLFGYGPGSWLVRFPRIQIEAGVAPMEIHGQAHNEFLDLAYQGGLVALLLLGRWLWSRRKVLLASCDLPAVVAVGVLSLTGFPFQVAATVIPALTVLGFATMETRR